MDPENYIADSNTLSPHRLGLNASEQREFQARMERKQMKEFMNVRLPPPLDSPSHHLHPEQQRQTTTSNFQPSIIALPIQYIY